MSDVIEASFTALCDIVRIVVEIGLVVIGVVEFAVAKVMHCNIFMMILMPRS